MILAAIDGSDKPDCEEIAVFGTRGDGKTIGALVAMTQHAIKHKQAGYPLPVHWMGVADTFTSHKLKTIRSMEHPMWKGGWQFEDGDHVAVFRIEGQPLVRMDLFGIEDQGAMDRVRMETTGVWFEEPAPAAVLVQSSGISLDAWLLARTSQRIPSHFKPALLTCNYPDEDHWTWDRFVANQAPGSRYFRIPPGERASAEDRAEWTRALGGRPDLVRRLLEGQPGVVLLGDQVAKGFMREMHTTQDQLNLIPGEPLIVGADFWHTPTCIIGQQVWRKGFSQLIVKAGLYMQGVAMKQLMEDMVMPWCARFAPWALRDPNQMWLCGHDPTGETPDQSDIESTALKAMRDELGGGQYEKGPTRWEPRREALVRTFSRAHGVLIEQNQFTADLIRALDGRWYCAKSHQGELRSDKPKKPNHPWEDLGDAFIYFLIRAGIVAQIAESKPIKVERNLNWG